MFSRIRAPRMNRGRVAVAPGSGGAAPVTATDPLTIVSSVANISYLIADLGVTTIGAGVSLWSNQGPSAATGDATQGTGVMQPTHSIAGGPGGKGMVSFNGTNHHLIFASLDLPAPGTTPTWFWFVLNQRTWTSGDSLFGSGAAAMRVRGVTASPQNRANNTSDGPLNAGAVLASYVRGENLYGNSIADYLKLGATSVTGTNTGNADPALGATVLGAHTTAAGFSAIDVALFAAWAGKPSAGEIVNLDAWVTSYYAGGVAL